MIALNSSKSAYASITLASNKFFEKYYFTPIRERGQSIEESKFACKIHNKVPACYLETLCHTNVFSRLSYQLSKAGSPIH